MLQINIKQLVAAVQDATPFVKPEMNEGTSYLHSSIYNRLSRGWEVRLSDLDFNAFDSEDISSLSCLYRDVYEQNNYKANRIADTLRNIVPVCKTTAYV